MSRTDQTCPVCHFAVSVPFYEGGLQPLATLGWPATKDEAVQMPQLPHDFVQCPACTHVWNRSFEYSSVPYKSNPNLMYNNGAIWRGHLALTADKVADIIPENPVVVEIGSGTGHFINGIAERVGGGGSFYGFDPNNSERSHPSVDFQSRLFDPATDMVELKPDAIILRHIIEHLTHPSEIIDQLGWYSQFQENPCRLFVETPCIDRVFDTGRIADFFYEHVSHFTTRSFAALMSRAGEVEELGHGYDGEVVFAFVKLEVASQYGDRKAAAETFRARAVESRQRIRTEIDQLSAQSGTVAVWGGTGKAAAFIQQFGLDAIRFPLVVDSDPNKVGTFVPGVGQEIRSPDVLQGLDLETVIIPTQWRAKDIVAEIQAKGLRFSKILIEDNGRLVDFLRDEHGYERG